MVYTLHTEEPVFSVNLSATGTYTGHGRSGVSRLYSVVHTNFKHELHDQRWVHDGFKTAKKAFALLLSSQSTLTMLPYRNARYSTSTRYNSTGLRFILVSLL